MFLHRYVQSLMFTIAPFIKAQKSASVSSADFDEDISISDLVKNLPYRMKDMSIRKSGVYTSDSGHTYVGSTVSIALLPPGEDPSAREIPQDSRGK